MLLYDCLHHRAVALVVRIDEACEAIDALLLLVGFSVVELTVALGHHAAHLRQLPCRAFDSHGGCYIAKADPFFVDDFGLREDEIRRSLNCRRHLFESRSSTCGYI